MEKQKLAIVLMSALSGSPIIPAFLLHETLFQPAMDWVTGKVEGFGLPTGRAIPVQNRRDGAV